MIIVAAEEVLRKKMKAVDFPKGMEMTVKVDAGMVVIQN